MRSWGARFGDLLELSVASRLLNGKVINVKKHAFTVLGSRGLSPLLEDKLIGKFPGDAIKVKIPPEEEKGSRVDKVQVFRTRIEIIEELGLKEGKVVRILLSRLITANPLVDKDSEEQDWEKIALQDDEDEDEVEFDEEEVYVTVLEIQRGKKFAMVKLDLNPPYSNETIEYKVKIRGNHGTGKEFVQQHGNDIHLLEDQFESKNDKKDDYQHEPEFFRIGI
jgi:FKBP-type peptidyl-prolyl cis-trans isomerase 2